jgi:hypothetical protein
MNTPIADSKNIVAAWQKRADWLARWTLSHLVNRHDLWGRYFPLEKRSPGPHGEPIISRLAPSSPKKRGVLQLSERALIRHYRGADVGDLIGLHSASGNNHSRWMAIDLDRHNKDITPLDNLRAATHWQDELISHGFHPLLMDTDGLGGYCLLVLFRETLPTSKVHDFAERLVRDHADLGLAQRPTIHPSSAIANPQDWLRLPGRHPAVDHWTRVWNGRHWQDGADAVEALLHAHGDLPTLIRKFIPSAGSGFYAAPHPAETQLPVTEANGNGNTQHETKIEPRSETQVLAYLLAATRTGDERAAFTATSAANLSADSFTLPTHRHIYHALQTLHAQGERITPTDIAEEIPAEHRPVALSAIDELILEKPIDEQTFVTRLKSLTARMPVPQIESNPDTTLQMIVSAWPSLSPSIRQAIATLVEGIAVHERH